MARTTADIPIIDIAPLFEPSSSARDAIDREIAGAAANTGFLKVKGLPEAVRCDAALRDQLLRLFAAPRGLRERLACNRRDPSRPLVLHGWFDVRPGRAFHYEGMEIGPDVAHGATAVDPSDPLSGRTPLPADADLLGWRAAVRAYYLGLERTAEAIMRALARGLGIAEEGFCDLFVGGSSALRLLRYPVRSERERARVPEEEGLCVLHEGERREVINEAHVDYGVMTLLAQDDSGGLQARLPSGAWIDVPPDDGGLVINFGQLLAHWTAGHVRATEHRVLSPGRERFSIPFFYAPRLDAEIAPLPLPGAEPFQPFPYRDHVWESLPKLRRLFGDRSARWVSSEMTFAPQRPLTSRSRRSP